MTRLSDLVRGEGYGFRVVAEPWREPDPQGNPPDPHLMPARLCLDGDGSPYVACTADDLDHTYSASHEIAEHVVGHRHTRSMLEYQANVLAAWVRRSAAAAAPEAADAFPAPTGHPGLLVTLCAATGAVLGAYIGWHAAGRSRM